MLVLYGVSRFSSSFAAPGHEVAQVVLDFFFWLR